jgi:hypothetical protein
VALLAMMGTGIAAVVAGFTTVTFPIEQLLVMRGMKKRVYKPDTRESHLADLLFRIARLKRKMIAQTGNHDGASYISPADFQKSGVVVKKKEERGVDGIGQSSFLQTMSSTTCRRIARLWRHLDTQFIDILKAPESMIHRVSDMARRKNVRSSISASIHVNKLASIESSSLQRDRTRGSLFYHEIEKEITALESDAKIAFRGVVDAFEIQSQVDFSNTASGRWLWIFGLFMSSVAVLRLILAATNIGGAVVVSRDGAQEKSDIEYILSYVSKYAGINIFNWNIFLHIIIVGSLGLMQIRAFLGSMMRMAKLGLLSTNTELYALVLAYLSGLYFLASVVLLRTQLPLVYRKGITVALGAFDFAIFSWIFDCLFVISSICSAIYTLRYSSYSILQKKEQVVL